MFWSVKRVTLAEAAAVSSSLLPPVDKPATFLSLSLGLNMNVLMSKKLSSVTEKRYACKRFVLMIKLYKGRFHYICTHDSSAEKKEIK